MITQTAVELPDGRILLWYNVWFYDDIWDVFGLASTHWLLKQMFISVQPGTLEEM